MPLYFLSTSLWLQKVEIRGEVCKYNIILLISHPKYAILNE